MSTKRKLHKSRAVNRTLTQFLRATKGWRRELVAKNQLASLRDDEMLVLVLGRRRVVARSLRLPSREVADHDLQIGAEGAAIAVEQLGSRRLDAPVPTHVAVEEDELLRAGGFELPRAGSISASDVGRLEYLRLLSDSLSTEQAAQLLKVNASRARQRLAERKLFGIKDGGSWKLPRFQFVDGRLVPGIDQVIPSLPPGIHPVAVQRWFRIPHPDLESESGKTPMTPLEWLESGYDPDRVSELAAML